MALFRYAVTVMAIQELVIGMCGWEIRSAMGTEKRKCPPQRCVEVL